jgi:hypothetical protein
VHTTGITVLIKYAIFTAIGDTSETWVMTVRIFPGALFLRARRILQITDRPLKRNQKLQIQAKYRVIPIQFDDLLIKLLRNSPAIWFPGRSHQTVINRKFRIIKQYSSHSFKAIQLLLGVASL